MSNQIKLIVAHDYLCPMCWVGFNQINKLEKEFPQIKFEWQGYELYPKNLAWPDHTAETNEIKKPRKPTVIELLALSDGLKYPFNKGPLTRTGKALEGAEYAKEKNKFEEYNESVYRAYWEHARNIGDIKVLQNIAENIGLNIKEFNAAVEQEKYAHLITPFDDEAHEKGVWNVPTFQFPDEWIAEQPYIVVQKKCKELVDTYVETKVPSIMDDINASTMCQI